MYHSDHSGIGVFFKEFLDGTSMKTSKDVIRPSSAQWRVLDLKTLTSTRFNLKFFDACFQKNTPGKLHFTFFTKKLVRTAIYIEVGYALSG